MAIIDSSVPRALGLAVLCLSFSVVGFAASPEVPPAVIAFVGDSLAQGYGVAETEAFPSVAAEWLKRKGRSVVVVNASVSGSLSSDAEARVRWVLRRKPAIVVLELGANDALKGTPVSVIKQNLAKAIDVAKAGGAKPLLAGMRIFESMGKEYARGFAAIFSDLAKEKRVALMPFLLEGVAAQSKFNQPDGKHPNAEGHRIVGEAVGRALEALL